jgi:hypothetical protein
VPAHCDSPLVQTGSFLPRVLTHKMGRLWVTGL